jgi:hypothetical protein
MKTQMRAGAVLLAGVLAGSGYAMTLTLPQQQQGQQDNSGQQGQQDKDKKKKGNSPGGNSNNAPASQPSGQSNNQGGAPPPNNPPPNNPPPAGNPPNGDKPTPLFGGSIGLKSSRQTKDSATLGFNGVDPNGQVQKSFLSAAVTPNDALLAQQLAQSNIAPADLVQFIQDGGLNPDAAPQKP